MKAALIALFSLAAIDSAYTQEPTACAATAAEKKLIGAALKSFMAECERDARGACDVAATEKKLHGAARTSFTNKCMTDAVRDYD